MDFQDISDSEVGGDDEITVLKPYESNLSTKPEFSFTPKDIKDGADIYYTFSQRTDTLLNKFYKNEEYSLDIYILENADKGLQTELEKKMEKLTPSYKEFISGTCQYMDYFDSLLDKEENLSVELNDWPLFKPETTDIVTPSIWEYLDKHSYLLPVKITNKTGEVRDSKINSGSERKINLNEFFDYIKLEDTFLNIAFIRKASWNGYHYFGVKVNHYIVAFEVINSKGLFYYLCERTKDGSFCYEILTPVGITILSAALIKRPSTNPRQSGQNFVANFDYILGAKYDISYTVQDYEKGYHPFDWNCEMFAVDMLNCAGVPMSFEQIAQLKHTIAKVKDSLFYTGLSKLASFKMIKPEIKKQHRKRGFEYKIKHNELKVLSG